MKLIKNGINLSQNKIIYRSNVLSKIIHKGTVIYETGAAPYFPRSPIHVGVIGDSTIAAGYGGLLVPQYITAFSPITSVAAAGDTIKGQMTKYSALTNTMDFDVVVIQIGLNDMASNQTTETVLTNYQNLVSLVRSNTNPRCKVYVAKMLPCRQRFIDYYGATAGLVSQQRWLDLNNFIMNAVTGVDGRIDSHVPLLDDGNGNLKLEYDTGDHIHENVAGRQIIANAWRDKLIADQILSV